MWAFVQRVTNHHAILASLLNVQLGGPILLIKSHSLAFPDNSSIYQNIIYSKKFKK